MQLFQLIENRVKGMAMIFTMPKRDATLLLWNDAKLERRVLAYVSLYNSKPNGYATRLKWIEDELAGMDIALEFCSGMDDMPAKVWDRFHDRWRDASVLNLHIHLNSLHLPKEDCADFAAREVQDFFDEDTLWLQKRPNNN